ncbi:MAG: MFS transporter [Ktedonobacteraceae bacterium]|nr:MFS transporter [Ktedonobacteraceae bacterium]
MVNFGKAPCNEGVIESAPGVAPCPRRVGTWVLVATILCSSMAFIDGSVVNVALPVMQQDLKATATEAQWVVEAYLLFLSALILVGGALGDRLGRRRIFAIGIVCFTLASLWCGLSPSVLQLIVARALQGIGGALLVPGSLAIISASFSEEQRGRAIGTWSGFTAITSVAGPVIGGWLVQYASWRWVFFINVPLAVIVLAVLFWRVPESRDEKQRGGLDWQGAALATFALGTLVYGLIQAGYVGFGQPLVLACLGGSVLAAIAFVIVESRVQAPMVPLALFRLRAFSGTNGLTLFLYSALGAMTFFLPFNLIQVQGYSATAAGAALVPLILILFLLSRWAGGLVKRYGARLPLVVGPTVAAIGYALFAVPGIGGSYWTTFFPAALVLGLGMTITVAPLTTTVMGAVEQHHAGTASGINNAVARVAGLLAIAVLGIVMATIFTQNLESHLMLLHLPPSVQHSIEAQYVRLAAIQLPATDPATQATLKKAIGEAFVSGFRLIMLICAGLALLSALCAGLTIEGRRAQSRQ